MAMLIPHSLPAGEVQPYLAEGERVVSSFGPYHATSRRVILVIPPKTGIHLAEGPRETRVHELPYITLESITEIRTTDRKKMLLGACLSALGLATIFAWYLILPIVSVVAGVFIILQGASEKPAYYQLKGRGMEGEDLHKWQVIHYGSGSFIASISTMTGVQTARD